MQNENLPDGYQPLDAVRNDGNCLFDSFSLLTGIEHTNLRNISTEYIKMHFDQFMINDLNLLDSFLIVDKDDTVAHNSLGDYILNNHVIVDYENNQFKYTKAGYIHHINRSNVFGQLPSIVALSNLFSQPVEIYMRNGNSYTLSKINSSLPGQTIRLILANQHYRPLIIDQSSLQLSQVSNQNQTSGSRPFINHPNISTVKSPSPIQLVNSDLTSDSNIDQTDTGNIYLIKQSARLKSMSSRSSSQIKDDEIHFQLVSPARVPKRKRIVVQEQPKAGLEWQVCCPFERWRCGCKVLR